MELAASSDPGPAVKDADTLVARVLLVDDQPMVGEAIRRMLANERDIEFLYCASSTEAVATAIRCEPTVILQDLVMPDVDGITLLHRYREDPRTRSVPIIVLSSKEDPRVKRDAFTAGADDYLVKLPDDVELIARVRHHSRAYLLRVQRDAAYLQLSASRQQLVIANADLQSALQDRMAAQLALQQRNTELTEVNRKLEEAHVQMLQSEKMASVGQLAAGVAHEINNPVAFVTSNLGTLRTYVRDLFRLLEAYDKLENAFAGSELAGKIIALKQVIQLPFLREDIFSLITESIDGAERVTAIVKGFRDFSGVDKPGWQLVNVHDNIENALVVAKHEVERKAHVVRDFADLPPIECLSFQLNQVFLNLLINACQAIEGRGTITIRTEHAGEVVRIHMIDTGHGIAPENLSRVFDPFFTTKPVGTGPGLGLTVAYNILKIHGGTIEAASEVGRGSTFTVVLPLKWADRPARG